MRVPLVLPVAFVSCLAAAGCGTTVSLKQPAATAPLAPSAASPAPPTQPASPAMSPAGPALASQGPPPAIVPPASGMSSPAQSGGAVKRRVTMGDRMASGMQTGSVGAFFGAFGGPIGFAAGGGAGFLIGFIAGQSPLGPPAPEVRSGSWENEVESQRAWEAQVRDHLAQLDAQAQGQGAAGSPPARAAAVPPAQGMAQTPSGAPVTDAVATAGGADPMADYEAWSRQITAYAQPAVARAGVAGGPAAKVEAKGPPKDDPKVPAPRTEEAGPSKAPGDERARAGGAVSAVDSNGDGRQDTWFIYEGNALRMQAVDRTGDGRPDREDVYTKGKVTSRRLDNDADGRFETIETIEDDTIAGWVMDLDGDGRYESRSVRDAEGVHHVERDADGDGRTDAWIMMIGEGAKAAVREQVDTDRDGKADTTTIYMDGHVVKQGNATVKKAGTGS